MHAAPPGIPLRQILVSLGESILEMQVAPGGLEVDVRDVVICDATDEMDVRAHELGLLIGARDRAAVSAVEAAGRSGAAAVAVKREPSALGLAEEGLLAGAARDAGVALLSVPADVRWDQLESLVRGMLSAAQPMPGDEAGEGAGDLFGLAQTLATVTSGAVSIEDTASRVLAYSSTSDEVDELRRLSILGRKGPDSYLAMLREWGVYEQLRTEQEAVRVTARPELGIRERLAVGIHAGARQLGTIWIAETQAELAQRAERALVGAARLAAVHLVRGQRAYERSGLGLRFRENLLAGLLDGRMDGESVAEQIGATPYAAAAVIAFARADDAEADRSQLELIRNEMMNVISVHAAAYRRSALVTELGGRVYVLLPELEYACHREDGTCTAVRAFAEEVTSAVRRQLSGELSVGVQAALGSLVPRLADARQSRTDCDRVLDALAGRWDITVAAMADVRSDVLLAETAAMLDERPGVRDPRVTKLREHDTRYTSRLAQTLLCYLHWLGDVRTAAQELGVHPNTVRYRVRRAAEVSGIDLDDPKQRVFAQLQLMLTSD